MIESIAVYSKRFRFIQIRSFYVHMDIINIIQKIAFVAFIAFSGFMASALDAIHPPRNAVPHTLDLEHLALAHSFCPCRRAVGLPLQRPGLVDPDPLCLFIFESADPTGQLHNYIYMSVKALN